MKITEEKLELFIKELTELNNSIEDETISHADRVIALQGQLMRVERMRGWVTEIAKQAAEDPSSPFRD